MPTGRRVAAAGIAATGSQSAVRDTHERCENENPFGNRHRDLLVAFVRLRSDEKPSESQDADVRAREKTKGDALSS